MTTSPTSPGPIDVFFSYAHEDELLLGELLKHLGILKRLGVIRDWHDRMITAGTEWKGQIDHHLNAAGVILLLVSADFVNSDYCWDVELKRALERHDRGEARVIPVIMRHIDGWQDAPFGKLLAVPTDGRPVTDWPSRDQAFADVAGHIRKAVEELRNQGGATQTPIDQDKRRDWEGMRHDACRGPLPETPLIAAPTTAPDAESWGLRLLGLAWPWAHYQLAARGLAPLPPEYRPVHDYLTYLKLEGEEQRPEVYVPLEGKEQPADESARAARGARRLAPEVRIDIRRTLRLLAGVAQGGGSDDRAARGEQPARAGRP